MNYGDNTWGSLHPGTYALHPRTVINKPVQTAYSTPPSGNPESHSPNTPSHRGNGTVASFVPAHRGCLTRHRCRIAGGHQTEGPSPRPAKANNESGNRASMETNEDHEPASSALALKALASIQPCWQPQSSADIEGSHRDVRSSATTWRISTPTRRSRSMQLETRSGVPWIGRNAIESHLRFDIEDHPIDEDGIFALVGAPPKGAAQQQKTRKRANACPKLIFHLTVAGNTHSRPPAAEAEARMFCSTLTTHETPHPRLLVPMLRTVHRAGSGAVPRVHRGVDAPEPSVRRVSRWQALQQQGQPLQWVQGSGCADREHATTRPSLTCNQNGCGCNAALSVAASGKRRRRLQLGGGATASFSN